MADMFEQKLQQDLRQSEQQVSDTELSTLAQARAKALATTSGSLSKLHDVSNNKEASTRQPDKRWYALASAAVIMLAIALLLPPTSQVNTVTAAIEHGPHHDVELYENLSFYEWLAEQDNFG